jgi:hypothetical protein
MQEAYKDWPVTVVEGTVGTGDISNVVQNVATDANNQPTFECGIWTGGIVPYSTVGYDCAMKNTQFALGLTINNGQDEAAALRQESLIQAIGRATGNISAHEIAHQFIGLCCGMDAHTSDDPAAGGTYNNGIKAGGTPTFFDPNHPNNPYDPNSDLADYTGYGVDGKSIHWEDSVKQKLTACFGTGYRRNNPDCPTPNH